MSLADSCLRYGYLHVIAEPGAPWHSAPSRPQAMLPWVHPAVFTNQRIPTNTCALTTPMFVRKRDFETAFIDCVQPGRSLSQSNLPRSIGDTTAAVPELAEQVEEQGVVPHDYVRSKSHTFSIFSETALNRQHIQVAFLMGERRGGCCKARTTERIVLVERTV